jgi:hypothetical protein
MSMRLGRAETVGFIPNRVLVLGRARLRVYSSRWTQRSDRWLSRIASISRMP